jgi:ketosteroid isomerase-like protein
MGQPTPAQRMEHVIRTYIQACNDADAEAIAASFCPDAVHYFPSSFKWAGAAHHRQQFCPASPRTRALLDRGPPAH